MLNYTRSIFICIICLFIACALILSPLGTTYSQKRSDSESRGQEKRSGQKTDTDDDDFAEQEDKDGKRRKDPCDHLSELPDKAEKFEKEIKKRCRSGSSSGISKADFDGNGFADLAVGIPLEDTPVSVADSGAVIVIYGSADGLTAGDIGEISIPPHAQFWSQNTLGVPGASEAGDNFGSALAGGDFNNDGFSDLAIGVPGEDLLAVDDGGVVIIYGSLNGLTTTDFSVPAPQLFNAVAFPDTSDTLRGGINIGAALAWGDFNGDGIGDLAIGVPRANVPGGGNSFNVGAVWILVGTSASRTGLGGLTNHGTVFDGRDVRVGLQAAAEFGATLAAGDFDGDGKSDLAIGIPSEDFGGNLPGNIQDAGEVGVLFGFADFGVEPSFRGLSSRLDEFDFFEPIGSGLPNIAHPAAHNFFGDSLAAGDFDGDGRDDLAIGAPNEDFQNIQDVGAVFVAYGFSTGLGVRKQGWNRNSLFGVGSVEDSDEFGFSLAAGDFDGNGRDDLAVGVPFRDLHSIRNGNVLVTIEDAGEVNVIYGSAGGLSTLGRAPQNWTQDSPNVLDSAQAFDKFGFSLSAWNFGRNQLVPVGIGQPPRLVTTADLAIGVPLEDINSTVNAGAVNVIYGSPSGLNAGGGLAITNQLWTAGSLGIPSTSQQGAAFGTAMY